MRRKVKNRNVAGVDPKFNSETLGKFINYTMWDGKKVAAEKAVYGALDIIKEKLGTDPLEVFDNALKK
jgi:small subunit ribosomal protein S7